ncbi:MAG TPA: site-2 protease family protein [Chryseosolibacter sp.]
MRNETKRILFQVGLFVVTFVSTTIAGSEWAYGRNIFFSPGYGWQDFVNGLSFSIPLLLILTVHEFGHYFVALYHKVKTSLPYYIPLPPIPFLGLSIGTMGAVIRLRSKPVSNLQNFDIGLAGPLAGFIVALLITVYAFVTLPPPEYVFQFHPEYKPFGLAYADTVYTPEFKKSEARKRLVEINKELDDRGREARERGEEVGKRRKLTEDDVAVTDVQIGNNLVFWAIGKWFAEPERIPNTHEMMHYPILLACYIALFFTCLNLLPIGQLDGGHVVYGLFGFKAHKIIATVFFFALMFYAGLGLPILTFNQPKEWLVLWLSGYVLFLFMGFRGLGLASKDTWMYAVLMAAAHFLLLMFFPTVSGYPGWLLFAFVVGRFVGIEHPRSEMELPLDSKRIILGWICLLIFIVCFSPAPIVIE